MTGAKLGEGADAQKLILKYTLADGSETEVKVDFAAIAFNTEFKNGLQVAKNGEISVQVDAASESFLTVGEGGVKLAGVQEAINTAVAEKNVSAHGDEYITATTSGNTVSVSADVHPLTVTPSAEGSTITGVEKSLVDGKEVADKVASFTNARIGEEIAKLDATVGATTVTEGSHVAVQVVEADGKITAVNVNEKDIASATTLASVKKAQEANTALLEGIPADKKVKGYVDEAVEAAKKAATTKVVKAADAAHLTVTAGTPAADGSVTYTIGETDIASAATLASVKNAQEANTTAISGAINEDEQSISLGNKGLQFVAFTEQEIRDAAK